MNDYNDKGFYDQTIQCLCGKEFIWTAGEQEFLDDLKNQGKIPNVITPKRCPDCRLKNKIAREQRARL